MRYSIVFVLLLIAVSSLGQNSNIHYIFAEFEVNGVTVSGEASGFYGGMDFTGQTILEAANIDFGKVLNANGSAGQSIERPLVLKKRMDRASIPLIDALNSNKQVDTMTIRFISIDNSGSEIIRFMYQIFNAKVLSVKHNELLNPQTGQTEVIETVRLTYQYMSLDDLLYPTSTVIDNTP